MTQSFPSIKHTFFTIKAKQIVFFGAVIVVYCKNDKKQIITLGGWREHRFCSVLKQVVHTINHCLKGFSYVV
jgi:hypothetical protein